MESLDPITRRLTYLQQRKNASKASTSLQKRTSSALSKAEQSVHLKSTVEPEKSVRPATVSRRAVESECEDFYDLRDRDMRRVSVKRHNWSKKDRQEYGSQPVISSLPDFGQVLAERRQKSLWLKTMREKREAQSDYERYSLEYVLRRKYETIRAPHISNSQFEEQKSAAEWEKDVLFKAMQAAADRGLGEYTLVLPGPWTEKTLRTVREADLFGRAVHYLLESVFHSIQLRVRCEHAPSGQQSSDQCNENAIRLRISWDEVETDENLSATDDVDSPPSSPSSTKTNSVSSFSSLLCSPPALLVENLEEKVECSNTDESEETTTLDNRVDEIIEEHLIEPSDTDDDFAHTDPSARSFVFGNDASPFCHSEDENNSLVQHALSGDYAGLRAAISLPKTLQEEQELQKTQMFCSSGRDVDLFEQCEERDERDDFQWSTN